MLCKLRNIGIVAVFLLMMLPQYATAAGVQNTFDLDREDWMYWIPGPTINDHIFQESGWDSAMGSPGGALAPYDVNRAWFFMSPGNASSTTPEQTYGGDWNQLYGGTISFDLYIENTGQDQIEPGMLYLDFGAKDAPGTYYLTTFDLGPLDQWNTYSFEIIDAVFNTQGPSTPLLLSQNLDAVDSILIRGDMFQGVDSTYLDNVSIAPVPVPGALILFASGLLGLAGIHRRSGILRP